MAHILVIGASKGIGLETVKAALAAGHDVRAFARSAESIRISDDKLEKRNGDALQNGDIERALDGIDAVVQALGVKASDLFKPVTLFSQATRVLIAAMQKRGVKRLVAVTGFGAGDSRNAISWLQYGPFRLLLGRAYDDKDIQERLIKASKLNWTIVRPGVLTEGRRTGLYRVLVEPAQWRNGIISRADVADFIVKQLHSAEYFSKAPVLIRH
jgi:putative NADH-flavin reductase